MKLTDILAEGFNPQEWIDKGYALPKYDLKAIKEKTGFDVMVAIKNNVADKEPEEKPAEPATERRVKPVEEKPATPARRTSNQYKVVTPKA
jgi:hypothetical protein